jgi:hypothetical protein
MAQLSALQSVKGSSIKTSVLALTLCLLATACNESGSQETTSNEPVEVQSNDDQASELQISNQQKKNMKETMVTVQGTLALQEMEGGFMGFIGNDGKKYTPMGLPKEHMRDGLIIEIEGQLMPDMMTITQFGEVLKVENVRVIDESKAKSLEEKYDSTDL